MRIKVERHELSDHSEVFDVVLFQGGGSEPVGAHVRFHAYSELDADALSEGLLKLIDAHACEQVWT